MALSTTSRAHADPIRTCVGCRQRAAKHELLRVTAGSDAHGQPVVVPDPSATARGRGAHLHPTEACLDLAVRRRAFGRALRSPGISATPVRDHLSATTSTARQHLSNREQSLTPITHQGLEQ